MKRYVQLSESGDPYTVYGKPALFPESERERYKGHTLRVFRLATDEEMRTGYDLAPELREAEDERDR